MAKSIGHKQLISQCISELPTELFACPSLNYTYDKLSIDALMKIFVAAQLGKWESYDEIEETLEAHPSFCKSIGLQEISASQLSRRINDLPTEYVEKLFELIVAKIQKLTKDKKGINSELGKLKLLDSTHIKLPENLCDWAFVTNGWNVVKMHTRLVIISDDVNYPDKILPSTGNVGDVETANVLVEQDDATYIMDRGYYSKANVNSWTEQGISFVVRIRKNLHTIPVEVYENAHPAIVWDGEVTFNGAERPVRLVEYKDDQDRLYRVMTTRRDLSAKQIMDLYHSRWTIELFFKWIKQHLKLVKIWSTKPQGMWNQMFLAMIAYGLALILQLQMNRSKKRTIWKFLKLLRIYFFKSVKRFKEKLKKKKSRTSRGRQKIPYPNTRKVEFPGNVARIKPQKKK